MLCPDHLSEFTCFTYCLTGCFASLISPFHYRALQFMNRTWILAIWLFLVNFLEGFAVNGLANAGLPSIERQFQLTSAKSSLIPASQDIGALSLILFISFIGGRYNKMMWIASGSLMMAVGSVIFIIPHLAEEYQYAGKGTVSHTFCTFVYGCKRIFDIYGNGEDCISKQFKRQ